MSGFNDCHYSERLFLAGLLLSVVALVLTKQGERRPHLAFLLCVHK
nr:MAG TPA: hypothetical protein [Caudoviricetes sp.]DAR92069.1 MAG TPA: hypothetical protein [Caudoviricetes sp.]